MTVCVVAVFDHMLSDLPVMYSQTACGNHRMPFLFGGDYLKDKLL